MSRRALLLALAVAFALAVAACSPQEPSISREEQLPADVREQAGGDGNGDDGNGGTEQPAGESYRFVAVDIDFAEAPSTISAGNVTFELVNDGNLPHDVAIEQLGGRVVVEADGGETATGSVEIEPGDYTYYCNVPGHRQAGMEGTLTVE